ncbi:MAG TPA: HigA family addiction module antitoxin [Opitutaceae bacterium]
MPKLKNIHPGEVLNEEFLLPLNVTPYRLCKDTGIPQSRISEIINESRGISASTALRLARYFGTTPDFWLSLQTAYDLEEVTRKEGKSIDAEIKPLEIKRVA